jgi:hypothetical protein
MGSSLGNAVPCISLSRKSEGVVKDVKKHWARRAEEAKMLFILDVSNFMLKEIQGNAPKISAAGGEMDYAKYLKVGIVDDGDVEDIVAIYMDGREVRVEEKELAMTVLYFNPKKGSPKWVSVLSKYGPWPAPLLPVKVTARDAETISRRARPDEVKALSDVLMQNKNKIEAELLAAGARSPSIDESENAVGLFVREDLGYNVLRRELGMDGEVQDAHWRPAFKATRKYAKKSLMKVAEYIRTGNKNVFDLLEKPGKIETSVVKEGEGFAKELDPLLK